MSSPFVFFNPGIGIVSSQLFTVGMVTSVSYRFRLFRNNVTPTFSSVLGDFAEPLNTGYGPYVPGMPTMIPPAAGIALAPWLANTWGFTANALTETIYGWTCEVLIGGGWNALGAALLASPYLIPPGGGTLTLSFTWRSQRLP